MTGKQHPALEGVRPVHHAFRWMQDAYFRLHNRRQRSDCGTLQPLQPRDIAVFGESALNLSSSMMPFFFRVMEATDNEVLRVFNRKLPEKNIGSGDGI